MSNNRSRPFPPSLQRSPLPLSPAPAPLPPPFSPAPPEYTRTETHRLQRMYLGFTHTHTHTLNTKQKCKISLKGLRPSDTKRQRDQGLSPGSLPRGRNGRAILPHHKGSNHKAKALLAAATTTAQGRLHHINLLWCGGSAAGKPLGATPAETKNPRGGSNKEITTLTRKLLKGIPTEESEASDKRNKEAVINIFFFITDG